MSRTPNSGYFSLVLMKAKKGEQKAGHKYIMRIPVGPRVDPKTGKSKMVYRYIYDVHHQGRYVGDEEHTVEGARVRMDSFEDRFNEETGQTERVRVKGHWEIKEKTSDGMVIISHDKTGETKKIPISKFTDMIQDHWASQIANHSARLMNNIAMAQEYGSLAQQNRLMERAVRLGLDVGPNYNLIDAEPGDKGKEPEALALHEDALPDFDVDRVPEDVINMPGAPAEFAMKDYQVEGASRILAGFDDTGGFLLQDEAGTGKTVQALASHIASGSRRTLYVVPEGGKDNLKRQLVDDAGLFNLEVKDAVNADTSGDGIYSASYEELYDKVPRKDPDGNVMKDSKGKTVYDVVLKSQFANGFDMVVFDECHNMANPASVYGRSGVALQEVSTNCLYMSATPFTQIRDMHYLRKLGLFEDGADFANFAVRAGATVKSKSDPVGDLPFDISNPDNPAGMAAVSAIMHVQGKTIKRVPNLTHEVRDAETGQMRRIQHTADFRRLSLDDELKSEDTTPERRERIKGYQNNMQIAERVYQMAIDAGVPPFNAGSARAGYFKAQWEVCKADQAIALTKQALESGDGKGQAAIYFSRKAFDHQDLRSLAEMAYDVHAKAKGKAKDMDAAKHHRDEINKVLDGLTVDDPIKRIVAEFGADKVSQLHGDFKGSTKEQVEAYQSGKNRVVVATIAKAGTGLSLHDKKGDAPRHQINCGMPYTAAEFTQYSYRSHRLGSKSDTMQYYLLGEHDSERRVAGIIREKMESMGSLTLGDPGHSPNTEELANFEGSRPRANPDGPQPENADFYAEGSQEQKEAREASLSNAKKAFDDAVAASREGRDAIMDVGDKERAAQSRRIAFVNRKAMAQMHGAGFETRKVGEVYRVSGAGSSSTKDPETRKRYQVFQDRVNVWKRKNGGKEANMADCPIQLDKSTKEWVLRSPDAFRTMRDSLGKKGYLDVNAETTVPKSWDSNHIEDWKREQSILASARGEAQKSGLVSNARSFSALVKGALQRDDIASGGPFVKMLHLATRDHE